MLFNAWIKTLEEARDESGLSIENAATRAQVSTATWYRWQCGKTHPGPPQLESMADGVNLPTVVLALRYSVGLLRHYAKRALAMDESGAVAALLRDLIEYLASLLGDGPSGGETSARLRGVAGEKGAVWIDVNELVDAMMDVHPLGPPGTARKRHRPFIASQPIRKKKRRKR